MGDDTFVSTTSRKDDSVRAGTSSCVGFVATEDGEFIVRFPIRKAKPFVVVVNMRIVVIADCLTLLQVIVALRDSFVDVGLVVACGSTVVNALALLMVVSQEDIVNCVFVLFTLKMGFAKTGARRASGRRHCFV